MTATAEIRTYRLDRAALDATLKVRFRQGLRRVLLGAVIGLLPVSAMFFVATPGSRKVFPILVPVILVLVSLSVLRGRRLAKTLAAAEWDSYQLSMTAHVMRRFVARHPAVEILRPEVTGIFDLPGQGLTVAAGNHRFIFIPEQLVGYAGVREELAGWRAFQPSRARRVEFGRLGWMLLLMSLWVATGLIPNFWLGMLAGLALLVAASISIRETLRSQVLNSKQKVTGIGMLAFFMFAPFGRAILHFAFGMDVQWPK